jgi:hypothetical protein
MPWFILICLGFLSGFVMFNATVRHHALTLIIWICKITRWVLSKIITISEWLQCTLDKREFQPTKVTAKNPKPTEKAFDFATASNEEIYKYVQDHPEKIRVKSKGGG